MANFVVLHMEKGQGAGTRMSMHIERDFIAGNVDASRVKNDKELIAFPEGVTNRSEAIEQRIATAGLARKVGTNQVHVIRVLLSASPEAMQRIQDEDKLDDWCQASVGWLQDIFGKENVVSAVLHMDESTPHIHASLVPITTAERRKKKKEEAVKRHYRKKAAGARLSADDIMSRAKLKQYQTSYANAMASFGLERGIDGSDARHIGTKEYYTQLNRDNVTLQKDIANLQDQKSNLETDIQKEKTDFEKQRQELELQISKLNINKQGKEALLERLNGITSIFGKSKVQQALEQSEQKNQELNDQPVQLKTSVEKIQAKLDKANQDLQTSQNNYNNEKATSDSLRLTITSKDVQISAKDQEIHALQKQVRQLTRQLHPERYRLPDVVDLSRSGIRSGLYGSHLLAVSIEGNDRLKFFKLSDKEFESYRDDEVTLEELIGKHFTTDIDRALWHRWQLMSHSQLGQEFQKVNATMFSALPRIIFPAAILAAFNYPGGSSDGENLNIRHKSKEEIIQELIDQGYLVSY